MNQKLCPVCNTVNTNTDKCVNCGNIFELPTAAPVITSNVLDNMPIASTIPISTTNNIAPPLSSLQVEKKEPEKVQTPLISQVIPAPQVMKAPEPVATVNVSSAPVSVQSQTTQNIPNQVLPQMQVLLGQEPTLAKPEEKHETVLKINSTFNIFSYIMKAFIKPYDEYKNNIDSLSKPKNNLLIALIIVLALTIFGLFGTMISTVRVSGFLSSEVTWVWSNLKNIQYIKHIFASLFGYASVIYVISGVYFLAGLVIKKEVNFMKISSAVLTSFIPVAFITILMNVTSWFLPTLLSLLLYVFSGIYAVMSFIELINDQTNIENKNNRIYFNFTCISILFIIALLALKIIASF